MSRERRSSEPVDRLTEFCARMTEALDAAVHEEEYQANLWGQPVPTPPKCVVFLQDGEKGGLQMHGYEDDAEALSDVFRHLRAIFRANGSDLLLGGLEGPIGRG
jgi:hypothetical protein